MKQQIWTVAKRQKAEGKLKNMWFAQTALYRCEEAEGRGQKEREMRLPVCLLSSGTNTDLV
jgi:hypothetical protein